VKPLARGVPRHVHVGALVVPVEVEGENVEAVHPAIAGDDGVAVDDPGDGRAVRSADRRGVVYVCPETPTVL